MYLILYLFLLGILPILYFKKRKQQRINSWQKSLNLNKHSQIFQQLYHSVNGFILSRQARQNQDAIEYTYGEINFISFIALLSLVKPDKKTVFYDLGSGVGKAVIACAMVYPISKGIGIELFTELHEAACRQQKKLEKIDSYTEKAQKIYFISENFLHSNLNEATLIFINSSAFIGPTWEDLCAKLDKLPQLNTVITTSKALKSDFFTTIKTTQVEMSWGTVSAFIHQRKQFLT